MGLDQYLSVRKYIPRVDWKQDLAYQEDTPEFRNIVDNNGLRDFVVPGGYSGAFIEMVVVKWRKANAIHRFFVDNLAGGKDECQPIFVPPSAIDQLVEISDFVITHPEQAEDMLPTQQGFFFGDTDYDEYYFDVLVDTRDELKRLAEKIFTNTDELDLIYQASW